PLHHLVPLPAEPLGLLREVLGRGVHLAGGLVHRRLFRVEPGLALGQPPLHLGDAGLPLDQLLAERGDREPVLGPRPVEGCLLLADAVGLAADLRPRPRRGPPPTPPLPRRPPSAPPRPPPRPPSPGSPVGPAWPPVPSAPRSAARPPRGARRVAPPRPAGRRRRRPAPGPARS